jgi:alginate O-acetyltransferase complex protein AlgI
MLFSSIPFIIMFLPVTMLLYYCCPFLKCKNIILLIASLLFYAWGEPRFVMIMICSIVANYGVGLLIGNTGFTNSKRKLFLVLGVIINLSVLFFFKYLGFFEQILNSLITVFHLSGSELAIHKFILPLGISFYTFQSMSYLIDVYRKPEMVQWNILDLGLFISFFPQLIAGPIVRYGDICEQIKKRGHSLEMFAQGIERFIIGLAKKVLLANTMAEAIDGMLLVPYQNIPSAYLLLTVVSGILQIYYDFSGYSDMAIGLGRMFGFKIMENFNYPLASTSLTEFWRRWHISLSTWFRDYLYIPLGGSRKGKARLTFNTLLLFSLVGLWHGAAYNFIFFGFVCGLVIILEKSLNLKKFLNENKNELIRFIKETGAHIFYVSLCICLFMYFRLGVKDSFLFYSNMFSIGRVVPVPADVLFVTDKRFYIMLVFAIAFTFPWWRKLRLPNNILTVSIKYIVLLGLFALSFGTLTSDAYNPFIYFRF